MGQQDLKSKSKTPLNYAERLSKIEGFCAYQERCAWEVRIKLREWQTPEAEAESIIAELIQQNFLNEERYARAFAGGKFRIKKWGWKKIKFELLKREISSYCLLQAQKEIDAEQYLQVLKAVLSEKARGLKNKSALQRKALLVNYAVSRGFEADLALQALGTTED